LEPVALALGLHDVAAVSEPIEGRAGEALGAEDLCPGLEGQIARDVEAGALIGGRDDVEEQFGTDLGSGNVSQLDLCRLGDHADNSTSLAPKACRRWGF
jgi:hypothetical protein